MVPPGVRPLPSGDLPSTVTCAGGWMTRRTWTGAGVEVGLGSGVSVGVVVGRGVRVDVGVIVGVAVAVGIHGAPASPKTRSWASFEKYRAAPAAIRRITRVPKMNGTMLRRSVSS